MKFKVVLEKDEEGYIVATVPSLPGCISQGKSEEEAMKNIKEAIELHVESLAEDGLPLTPKRNVKEVELQVNV
ncbi:type II toxin-antitoxin system HicB family antitoxin [Candidatus Micrarchaeota archaeon]|nr:type II toxin-antitoxin system HicB family antitoxin [Candidatus Micrarchaeota archaeon]